MHNVLSRRVVSERAGFMDPIQYFRRAIAECSRQESTRQQSARLLSTTTGSFMGHENVFRGIADLRPHLRRDTSVALRAIALFEINASTLGQPLTLRGIQILPTSVWRQNENL